MLWASLIGLQGPAGAASGENPLAFTKGFTVLTLTDATLGNHEIEGTLAIGRDARFTGNYPVIHSSGLTPTGYQLPVADGVPVRMMIGNEFVPGETGVIEVSSNGFTDPSQIGQVKIGDVSNLAINPRGSTGTWLSKTGTPSGTEQGMFISDQVNQDPTTIEAPGVFDATLPGVRAAAEAAADDLANPSECLDSVETFLESGGDAGSRNVAITPGAVNYLNLTSDQLGDYVIDLVGGTLGTDTALVINVAPDPTLPAPVTGYSATMPRFDAASNTSASQPNTIAPYTVWNFGNFDGTITLGGEKSSGTLLAPSATLDLQLQSPTEGQVISDFLITSGGEIHHYEYLSTLTCGDVVPTSTTTSSTTTSTSTTSTTLPTTTTSSTTTSTTMPTTTTSSTTSTTMPTTTTSSTTTSTTTPTTTSTSSTTTSTTTPTTTSTSSTTTSTTAPTTTSTSSTSTSTSTTSSSTTSTSVPSTTSTTEVAPATIDTSTTAPGSDVSPAGADQGSGGGSTAAAGDLARTGADVRALALFGFGALFLGAALLVGRAAPRPTD